MSETVKTTKGQRWRRWGSNVLLLLVSLLVTILLVELVLHMARPATYKSPQYLDYDDVLGWHKRPGATVEHRSGEFGVIEKINEHGWRGKVYEYEKPPGVKRVMILGDSFAEGYTVDEEALFSHRLEQSLNRSGFGCYEVINTGTCGYSTDQEVLLYENFGKRYASDVVILQLCYNDIWCNSQPMHYCQSVPKPYFQLGEGRLRLHNSPVPRMAQEPFAEKPATTVGGRTKAWLVAHSCIYDLTRQAVKRNFVWYKLALRWGVATLERSPDYDGNELKTPLTFGCWDEVYSDEIKYCWELTAALLERLRDDVHANHAELLVMLVPNLIQFDEQALRNARKMYGLTENQRPERIGEELARVCARLQIGYLDPTSALHDRQRQTGRPTYFREDGHWNALGHEVIADVLYQALKPEAQASAAGKP